MRLKSNLSAAPADELARRSRRWASVNGRWRDAMHRMVRRGLLGDGNMGLVHEMPVLLWCGRLRFGGRYGYRSTVYRRGRCGWKGNGGIWSRRPAVDRRDNAPGFISHTEDCCDRAAGHQENAPQGPAASHGPVISEVGWWAAVDWRGWAAKNRGWVRPLFFIKAAQRIPAQAADVVIIFGRSWKGRVGVRIQGCTSNGF
jgi:hypothetical protein